MPIVAVGPQLFAIMAQTNLENIGAALTAKYPSHHLLLYPGQWLLVASGKTAKEVCDDLGISTGETGNAVVITGTGSYFGRTNPGTWEWLNSRLGAPNA